MKRCPQCRAEYEDHVQFCFVDGTELRAVAASEDSAVGRSPRASGRDEPQSVTGEAEASGGWTRPVTGVVGLALTAIGGIGILGLAIGVLATSMRTPANTTGDRIDPDIVPRAQGEATPSAAPTLVKMIHFESDPAGASVFEAHQQLCTTPCEVEHPDYAPRTRSFVFKAKGYAPVEVEVVDAASPERVRLKPLGPAPRPTNRPGEAPDILPHR